jgi:hypothetical protein
LKLARDDEFLYVHCSCDRSISKLPESEPESKPNRQRKRDSLLDSSDHVRMRIDIDRDYATWFELAWNSDGDTLDRCGDMLFWEPNWFIANDKTASHWSSEIAIPIHYMLAGSTKSNEAGNVKAIERVNWAEQVWAISVVRSDPAGSAQTLQSMLSDRLQPDQWMLMDLSK